ncbi:chymotrypsin-2-like [Prorops nasuta]|uniref:chymotrypsin-2-like n=1 Tax=Prorops nasuta TaxID=863751 RepID=UPI0034CEB0EB
MQVLTAILFAGAVLCAYGLPSGRIVGGEFAPEGKYPYQVSLRYKDRHVCGGSIIDKRYILTAAHCLLFKREEYISIVAGITCLDEDGDEYDVESYLIHPDYHSDGQVHDIGIIKLDKDMNFTDKVKPIEPLSEEPTEEIYNVTLTGWGYVSAIGPVSNHLKEIHLITTTEKTCKDVFDKVNKYHICTLTERGEGACHGDSGGPLVNNQGKQVGIVSYGDPCARGIPDVYTRVSPHYQFILDKSKL